jgi:hypothetical protein
LAPSGVSYTCQELVVCCIARPQACPPSIWGSQASVCPRPTCLQKWRLQKASDYGSETPLFQRPPLKPKKILFILVKGVSLNHLYNAWNTMALHSSLGLVPLLLDPEALEKQCPLASSSRCCFSPLEIISDLPFGSPEKAS